MMARRAKTQSDWVANPARERYHVPTLCMTGMPIVRKALKSPSFAPINELLATAAKRRQGTLGRIRYTTKKWSKEQAEAIYRKTLKQVAQGSMEGPYALTGKLLNNLVHTTTSYPALALSRVWEKMGNQSSEGSTITQQAVTTSQPHEYSGSTWP